MTELLNNEIIAPLVGVIEVGILFRVVHKLMQTQGEEGSLKSAIKSCKKLMLASVIAVCTPSFLSVVRTAFGDGKNLWNGIRDLFTYGRIALLILEAGYLTFLEVCEGFQYQAAETEEKAAHKKKMAEMLVIGIMIISATGVLPAIWRYF